MSKAFKIWYGINIESREHALRGWNWGKAEFTKAELSFNVQNRPAFEIPYSEISNTNLAGKNEVAVEFALRDGQTNGASGQPGSTKNRGKKAASGPDELVEMRFYIPGLAVKKEKGTKEEPGEEGEEKEEEEEEEVEEQNAANLFYETLMDKAEIGDVAGDTFATFLDILHLTPRFVVPKFMILYRVLTNLQRSFRYRHVRVFLPVTWKDVRLQDPIFLYQEILPASEK